MARYDLSTTTLDEALKDPDVVAIVEQHAPGITTNPMVGMVKTMPVRQVMQMAVGVIGADAVRKIETDVEALD